MLNCAKWYWIMLNIVEWRWLQEHVIMWLLFITYKRFFFLRCYLLLNLIIVYCSLQLALTVETNMHYKGEKYRIIINYTVLITNWYKPNFFPSPKRMACMHKWQTSHSHLSLTKMFVKSGKQIYEAWISSKIPLICGAFITRSIYFATLL